MRSHSILGYSETAGGVPLAGFGSNHFKDGFKQNETNFYTEILEVA